MPVTPTSRYLSNAEVAQRLRAFAQILRAKGENPFKVRAYRRAADVITGLDDSVAELVRANADLTRFAGIGKGIESAVREIVESGTLRQLETLRSSMPPEVEALNEYPCLDPKRTAQVFKKLKLANVAELKEKFEAGVIGKVFGVRMEDHFRHAVRRNQLLLLDDAD